MAEDIQFKVDGKESDTSYLVPDTKRKLVGTLQRHEVVFREGLGTYTGAKVQIKMDATCTSKFFKARPVPFAQREAIEKELERLEKEDIIEPVSHSEWASPVVTVTKEDGSLRLYGDYKRSVNPACHVDQYPLFKLMTRLHAWQPARDSRNLTYARHIFN